MNISGVIRDAALRERLRLLAARAGWTCSLSEGEATLDPVAAQHADLFVCDDPAPLVGRDGRSSALVLLAGPSDDGDPDSDHARVDPSQADDALLLALNTCVNARRLSSRFAELERTEPITRLPRREQLLESLAPCKGRAVGLLIVQIDHAGHLYEGLDPVSKTDLLAALAANVQAATPATGMTGFYDAACFLIALADAAEAELAQTADELVRRLSAPLPYRHGELHLTVSVGYALEVMYGDAERLWREAWGAMRRAVESGGNRATGPRTPSVSVRLPQALARQEFSLVLQPQVAAEAERLSGAEVLLRWHGLEVGELGPGQFVPVAEQRGHMARIGDWVLERACAEAATWLEHLIEPMILGINVSPQQFHNGALLERIARYRAERWFDPAMLELELPQESLLTLVDDYRAQLYRLRDWGVRFALDNLGRGLIDAAKLLRCPADTLKIDRTLVARMDEDPAAAELISQICRLGARFQLRVVAVGVERESQLATLAALGCTDVQGYLFSPPVSPERFRRMLAREPDSSSRNQSR